MQSAFLIAAVDSTILDADAIRCVPQRLLTSPFSNECSAMLLGPLGWADHDCRSNEIAVD